MYGHHLWFLFQMFVPDPVIKSARNFLWRCFQILSLMPCPCHQAAAANCPDTISEEDLLDAEVGRSLDEFIAISSSTCTRGSPASSAVTLLQVGTHQSRFRSLLFTAFTFSGRRETARKIINLFREDTFIFLYITPTEVKAKLHLSASRGVVLYDNSRTPLIWRPTRRFDELRTEKISSFEEVILDSQHTSHFHDTILRLSMLPSSLPLLTAMARSFDNHFDERIPLRPLPQVHPEETFAALPVEDNRIIVPSPRHECGLGDDTASVVSETCYCPPPLLQEDDGEVDEPPQSQGDGDVVADGETLRLHSNGENDSDEPIDLSMIPGPSTSLDTPPPCMDVDLDTDRKDQDRQMKVEKGKFTAPVTGLVDITGDIEVIDLTSDDLDIQDVPDIDCEAPELIDLTIDEIDFTNALMEGPGLLDVEAEVRDILARNMNLDLYEQPGPPPSE